MKAILLSAVQATLAVILRRPLAGIPAAIVLILALAHIISALTLDRMIEYKEVPYASPKLPPAPDGFTIAFLTDFHDVSPQTMGKIVQRINDRGAEAVLLGGDFSKTRAQRRAALPKETEKLERILDALTALEAPRGVLGVAGNHDDDGLLAAALTARGMTLLENGGLRLADGLYLAGLEDLWTGQPDLEKALEGAAPGDFTLLLCHNPDTSMRYDFTGVDLALSGHTHGGEATFLGVWGPAVPMVSDYGQRFRSGWAKSAAGTDVFVSHGIGRHIFRSFCRPQVIFLTLRAQ